MRTLKPIDDNKVGREVLLDGGFESSQNRTIFMCSGTARTMPSETEVTLDLRETDACQEKTELKSVLARIQHEEVTVDETALNFHDSENDDGVIDGADTNTISTVDPDRTSFRMFDAENGQEINLSPQTFNAADSFINDSSESPGVSSLDNETVESSEEGKTCSDATRLSVKKPRPKASSPNRQGPQQCPVCNKVFGNASALAKHKLTHSDERKYVCTMCGKAFKRQDHLNGHMLTHRNKKPYECKAEGCGKSYCDARSLRRHTENHHAGIASSTTSSPSERSEDGSPQSCIQYAPPPSLNRCSSTSTPTASANNGQSKPVSQLQQLLASEPANRVGTLNSKSSSSQNNNDGLTKQQIDLIHQIMQQTQQQALANVSSSHQKCSTVSSLVTTTTPTSSEKQKNWTVQTNCSLTKGVSSSKPVECNLCHRKFKNIPALNGHMRLHGGYFKKDSDTKKSEKKDLSGPPLQTASMSVRALIEEKIIQRRINPTNQPQSITNDVQQHVQVSNELLRKEISKEGTEDSASKEHHFFSTVSRASSNDKIETESIKLDISEIGEDKELKLPSQAHKPSIDHPILKKASKLTVKRASSDPGLLQPATAESTRKIHIRQTPDATYSIGVYKDDGTCFTSNLADGVFRQADSVQESIILQGVDPTQLAESIQAASLQDIASLDGYTSPAESLSSPQRFPRHQDLQSVLDPPLSITLADFAYNHSNSDSPLTSQQPYVTSPLPSPCFAYPTPPGSQEEQSPSMSPLQQVISSNDSSPIATPFYSSSIPRSAVVEAALNQVLPQSNYSSPPPKSPTSESSSLPTPASSTLPLPHQPLQSQMMPNSEDPLLSSNPKDFAPRKKVGFHTFKLLHNGTIDFGSSGGQGVTGIVLDRNGELKLIQTSCFQSMKTGFLNGTTVFFNTKRQADNNGVDKTKFFKAIAVPAKSISTTNKLLKTNGISPESTKEETLDDDVFIIPSLSSSGQNRLAQKKLRLENLAFSTPYESRLRKIRKSQPKENLQYTPTPLLPPIRYGQGLYWQAVTSWSSSTNQGSEVEEVSIEIREPLYDSDAVPHINIGPAYQCDIPPCLDTKETEIEKEQLVWESSLNEQSSDSAIDMYLEFACCAAIPGGGRNKEYALHTLHLCQGKIHDAMLKLMQPTPCLPADHPLLSFEYADSERWTSDEIDAFQQALLKFDKDFVMIAQDIGSKTAAQCVQFYYIWKKVCPEDYKKMRMVRRRFRETERDIEVPKAEATVSDADIVSTTTESRLFLCDYADCSASFNSRAALNGHIRIHVGGTTGRSPTPDKRNTASSQPNSCEPSEEFPCKICGKVFNKVKSRSAHMKSHRPPDAETRKPKSESTNTEGTETNGRGGSAITSTQRILSSESNA